MLIYDNVEQLVADMFHTLEVDEDIVSVIADKDLTVEIMQELFTYENINLEYCDITVKENYNREYFCSLSYDYDTEGYYFCIEPAYNGEKGKYLGINGYVLFHEDVNSKALIDMQNNEMSFLTGHDWFVIGEDDSFEADDDEDGEDFTDEEVDVTENKDTVSKPVSCSECIFKVNGKEVDQETYNKALDEFDSMYIDSFSRMLNRNRIQIMEFINGYPRWIWR